MKLTTKQDIEAPIDAVFAALSDFESFELAAVRRGAEVARTDQPLRHGVGQSWRAAFVYRGKRRMFDILLQQMDAPGTLVFAGTSPRLEGTLRLDLVALSRNRTRVTVSAELVAKTLASRVFLHSMKLARGRIEDKFARRVRSFAMGIEDRVGKPRLG